MKRPRRTPALSGEGPASRILAVVARIPCGKVATYGQVAGMAGFPGHARQVGYALHVLPEGSNLPWHRVVGAPGRISLRRESLEWCVQQASLEAEGVKMDDCGRIALTRFQWRPAGDVADGGGGAGP